MLSPNRNSFSAVLLAAGVSRRLEQAVPAPKVLLEFAGMSLIARHIANLERVGAKRLTIVTGFEAEQLEHAAAAIGSSLPIGFVHNPRFREGSVVSLATAAGAVRGGGDIVLMDGDVLYDHRMLERLIAGEGEAVMLVDANIEPGDEPVKVCFDEAGTIVDFRKKPEYPHVRYGESVGFFRFGPAIAATLADHAEAYAADERGAFEYEEAIRDLLLADPARFAAEDVTDLPWTEIDFPEDVIRARDEILPQLVA